MGYIEMLDLDTTVLRIIRDTYSPMTLPQIEYRVTEKGTNADTFEVQRSVQRLIEKKLVMLTPYFKITAT